MKLSIYFLSYFTDNFVVDILISGGIYTLAIFAVMFLLSLIFKAFRIIFFSIILAIIALGMVFFAFEALEDFEFIPSGN